MREGLSAKTTGEVLAAVLTYEAVFTFNYMPEEFYWFTVKEMVIIQENL